MSSGPKSIFNEIIEGLKPENRLSAVQDEYGHLAPKYEERWKKFLKVSREWVLKRFPKDLPEGAKIIDLGCGTGAFLEDIHERFPKFDMIGIDGSFDMLDQARGKDIPVRFAQADFDQVDLGNGEDRYDVVLSMNVLHHLDNPEAHLSQIKSIVNDGGTVFVCDYAIDTPIMKAGESFWRALKGSHNKAFSSAELSEILKQAGFLIKETEILRPNGFWNIQIYKLAV